jgi:hypothetical protein
MIVLAEGEGQKQIPFGDDNQKDNGKKHGNGKSKGAGKSNREGEIQGSLHCAADGGAVRHFGRDDVYLRVG